MTRKQACSSLKEEKRYDVKQKMLNELFYPVFIPISMTTFMPSILGFMDKFKPAFVISVINSVGYLYLSIVLTTFGGENLFAFKVMMICFTIVHVALATYFGTEMHKELSGYERIVAFRSNEV